MPNLQTEISPELSGFVGEQDDALADLMSSRPPWLVRWGTIVFLVVVVLLGGIAGFVHYPDKVLAKGRLIAENGPQPLVIQHEGRLAALLLQDGAEVEKGGLIGVMESTADYQLIIAQRILADSVYNLLCNKKSVPSALCAEILTHSNHHLGELESEFQLYKNAMLQYWQYLPGRYFTNHQTKLKQDLDLLSQQEQLINNQTKLALEDLALAKQQIDAQTKLADQQIIAPMEYNLEKSRWLGKRMLVPQQEAVLLANTAQQLAKQKEIASLRQEFDMEPHRFRQSLEKWLAAIAGWEQQYLLYAPCRGQLFFSRFIIGGQYLASGERLGYVQPSHTGFFIEATLPQQNFGKLVPGQHAWLRLDAWPFEEFGMLKGRLEKIKAIPSDSGFLSLIALPSGLTTDRGIQVPYKDGLQVSVEIITKDRSLLSRFLDGIVKSFSQ